MKEANTKVNSSKQEKKVAKEIGCKTVVASGSLCINVGKYILTIDMCDFEEVSKLHLSSNGRYVMVRESLFEGKRKSYPLHKFLLNVHNDPNVIIDHRDRNGMNCTRENLRSCTRSENQANRRKPLGKHSSKYKGVSFDKYMSQWKVSIKVNKKSIHGGYFVEEIDAVLKYNELANLHFGEFAVLNEVI